MEQGGGHLAEAVQVLGQGLLVDPDQGRGAARHVAQDEGEVGAAVQQALEPVHLEVAPGGVPGGGVQVADDRVLAQPVGHQGLHGHHGQVVLGADPGRMQAGQPGQVHRGLGLAGAGQHPAGFGPQGEDMAGLDEIRRLGAGGDQGLDGAGAVVGGDPGGGAFPGLHAHAEGGLERAGVVQHHLGDVQAVQEAAFQGGADQAPAVGGHEGDGLGGDVLGRHGEIPFVLPVLVIHHDDHPPLADGLDGRIYGSER